MKAVNTPLAIRLEFVGFDEPSPRALSGPPGPPEACCVVASRAPSALRRCLKPEAAAALADLSQRTRHTYSAIIEEALLAASKR